MDERLAQGFVLTIQLSGAYLDPEVSELVLEDLAHLNAVRSPSTISELVLSCTVSAPTEGEAVRYGAQRTITAMLAAGVDAPKVISVDVRAFDDVLV